MPARLRAATLGLALVLAAAGAAAPSPSPIPAPAAPRSVLETPEYRLETDEILAKGNGDFTMPHHVAFARPGSDATADRAEGNRIRGTATLEGNVVVHDNGNAPESGAGDEYSRGGPATLTCDVLEIDAKAKRYVATGHVHFEQAGRTGNAQKGILDRTTGMLRLEGDVRMTEHESSLRAQTVDYNLTTKRVEAHGAPIRITQPVPAPEPGAAASPKPKKRKLPF